MADGDRSCANCGHAQASGQFCENCGTRMPATPTDEAISRSTTPTAAGVAGPAAAAGPGAAAGAAGAPGAAAGAGNASPPPPPPPPAYGAASQYGAPPPRSSPQGRSFWNRLFDFSFEEFITPTIIKVLFIVVMVVIGLTVLGMIVTGFATYGAMGIIWLVGALIWGFVALLFARVGLELVVIFFRIKDNTQEIAGGKRQE